MLSLTLAFNANAAGSSVSIEPQNVTNKPIKPSSDREIFTISTSQTTTSAVTVFFNPVANFGISDLAELTQDSQSGVALVNGSGQFIAPVSTPAWSGNSTTVSFNPSLPAGNYGVVIKFKPSISDGAIFTATIPENGVVTNPITTNLATTTAEFKIDNANPTTPSNIQAWDSAAKATALDPFKYYNFNQPYFEWAGAVDTANVNGYFVSFGTDPNADPLGGVRITHGPVTSFSDGPLPDKLAADYYLRVITIDNSGNLSVPSTLYIYRYDKKAPEKKPGAPMALTPVSDTTPTWEWEFAYDSDSGVTKYQFFWVKENSGQVPVFIDITTDPLLTTFTHTNPLDGGKWLAGVRAVDGAGNYVDSDLGSLVIDAPVLVPTIVPTPNNGSTPSSNSSPSSAPASPALTTNSQPAGKLGDFNNDGKVDLKDFNLLVLNWKKSKVPQDINNDGIVDLKDFNSFVFNWNK